VAVVLAVELSVDVTDAEVDAVTLALGLVVDAAVGVAVPLSELLCVAVTEQLGDVDDVPLADREEEVVTLFDAVDEPVRELLEVMVGVGVVDAVLEAVPVWLPDSVAVLVCRTRRRGQVVGTSTPHTSPCNVDTRINAPETWNSCRSLMQKPYWSASQ